MSNPDDLSTEESSKNQVVTFLGTYQRFKKGFVWFFGILFILLIIWIGKLIPEQKNQGAHQEPHALTEVKSLPAKVNQAGALSLYIEPGDHMKEVSELINNATKSIDLAMYEFDDPNIVNELGNAVNRGVMVRALLSKGYGGITTPMDATTTQLLVSKNVFVKYAPSYFTFTHQKTLIIDGEKAFIMTFNFTKKYYATSRDFGILDSNVNDVTAIEATFENDWNAKQIAATNGDDLVWSPGSENAMILVIESAQKTLEIYNEEMADDAVTQALIDAAKRGVAVRVDMTYQTVYKPSFESLIQGKVQVRTYSSGSKKRYIHAKMILADNDYAFVGSQNFSWTSLEKNRELGILISDPTTIASLEKTFNSDWTEARIFGLGTKKAPKKKSAKKPSNKSNNALKK